MKATIMSLIFAKCKARPHALGDDLEKPSDQKAEAHKEFSSVKKPRFPRVGGHVPENNDPQCSKQAHWYRKNSLEFPL